MLLTVPILSKGSFLGSLINKCRPASVANLSLNSPSNNAKSLEEKVGLPPKPKKPLSPYFRYMNKERPKLKASKPELSLVEIVKQIAKDWETVDASLKQRLQEEYKKEQQKYIEMRMKYESKITDEQRSQLNDIKQEKIVAKEKRIMRKRIKELGRPKKPVSSYLLFMSKERTSTPRSPTETFREWHKKATDKWSNLPEAEKNAYATESRKELEKYKKEITLWEEKMIRLGYTNVVRHSNLIDPPQPKAKKH